jgi:hypothetical protein
VSFSAVALGAPPLTYWWLSNSVPVTAPVWIGTALPNLNFTPTNFSAAQLTGTNYVANYQIVFSNGVGVVTSALAQLTVALPPLTIVSAGIPISEPAGRQTNIVLIFSQAVDPVTATTAASYSLNHGAIVLSATLGTASNTVILTTSVLNPGTNYNLTVQNVKNSFGIIQSPSPVSIAVGFYPPPSSFWAAPATTGTGDGSSTNNAANYLDATFWSGIQNALRTNNVNVNLLDGNYTAGTLSLTDMGNPLHRLILQAVDLYAPVFSGTGDLVDLSGSQNIKLYGIIFTGPSPYWAAHCEPDYLLPCRNLEFSCCQFINLTNAYYGAIGVLNGTRDVLVDNCTFSNLTDTVNGNHQHMIYASHNIVNLVATNCLFADCLADYVRFRDNSEYCSVQNCTFLSTLSGTAWPFVSIELFNETNSDAAGDEYFGNNFQVSSNTFAYNAPGGPGPYSALHFADSGYSPYSYDCDLTSSQASALGGGSVSYQQAFLQTNLGITALAIKFFGNTYNSRVSYHLDYTYNWDGIQPNGGWSGTVNLSSVPDTSGASVAPVPVLRNGNFDRPGLMQTTQTSSTPNQCLYQTWFCNPKYADILWHPGFNGTSNALRFDKTQTQYVYQWITPPGPTWTLDCVFTMGSGFTGTGTKFKLDLFHNDVAGAKISIGINDQGQFGIYNAGTFVPLPELGTVAFSADNNGNGYYNDAGDVLNVYRLRIVGNYAAATPYVNIYTSDVNGTTLTHQSLGRTYWVNGAPVGGMSSPETVAIYNYTAPVVVDQLAVAGGMGEQAPVITNSAFGSGKVVLTGTNGFAGDACYVLGTTNLAGGWTYEATNTFTGSAFAFTNTLAPGLTQKFYRLQVQ